MASSDPEFEEKAIDTIGRDRNEVMEYNQFYKDRRNEK
jgi:hypothetical protein